LGVAKLPYQILACQYLPSILMPTSLSMDQHTARAAAKFTELPHHVGWPIPMQGIDEFMKFMNDSDIF
jgi:hypothetical protein